MAAVLEKPLAYIEYEDYLVLERASQYKHEYLNGVVYAVQGDGTRGMAGGSALHADLIRNVGFALHRRLAGTPCSVKMSDMRLRVAAVDAAFYPDVLVHCTPLDDPSGTTELTEARLVVEILSEHTQRFDGGAKLAAYRALPGLRQIVLVSSLQRSIVSCSRTDDAAPWSPQASVAPGSSLEVTSLDLSLPWDEIYGGTKLDG